MSGSKRVPAAEVVAILLMFACAASVFAACPDFGARSNYAVGSLPTSIAVGDFNRDGIPDMAVTNEGANTVGIHIGNGNGTFAAATNVAVGQGPTSVAVGDFNRDGKLDLAVSNYTSNNVSILLGAGNGTFAAAVSYVVLGQSPYSVAAGDFNGDGKIDLAFANYATNSASLLLGNGDGTFTPNGAFTVGTQPYSVAVGDFNGDGKRDLAVANSGSNNVSILIGDGNGGFAAAVNYAVGTTPHSVGVGDLNGDGKSDLAVANFGSNDVSVLIGSGSGTFAAASNYPASSNPFSVFIGDIDVDGRADVLVASAGSNQISILLGNGFGALASPVTYSSGSYPIFATAADFNGDGKIDIAALNYLDTNLSVFLGNSGQGNGTFAAAVSYGGMGAGPRSIAVGDFNRDGKRDMAVVNYYNDSFVSIYIGNGNGTFAAAVNYTLPGAINSTAVATADFNGDGKLDLVVSNLVSDNVSILLGVGNGTFLPPANFAAGTFPEHVVVGDFNRDGKMDLAVANGQETNISILFGNGNGTFSGPNFVNVGSSPQEIAVGDFNRDGKTDLAVANIDSNNVSILIGDGNGSFFAPVNYPVGTSPYDLAVGDFNGDGKSDLAVGNLGPDNNGPDSVSILIGVGDGTFFPLAAVPVGTNPAGIVVGDFDADGKSDLAVTSGGSSTVSILLGAGNGSFAAAVDYGTRGSPWGLAVGDFNGDGKSDIAVADGDADTVSPLNGVSIFLNLSLAICIGDVTPGAGSTAGGQSVVISGTDLRYETSVTFDGVAALVTLISQNGTTADALTVTTPAHAAGFVDIVVTTTGGSETRIGGYRYVDPPSTPINLAATAVTTTSVDLSWRGVGNTNLYQIDRRAAGAGGFTQIGTSVTNSFTDTTASANKAYLYRVRATNEGGASGNSLPDLATTVIFTYTLTPTVTVIHAVDFTELRTAVNAVRVLAGLSNAKYTDTLGPTVPVKALHLTQLRDDLAPALDLLGLTIPVYTDSTITAGTTVIKAAHINELRAGVQ